MKFIMVIFYINTFLMFFFHEYCLDILNYFGKEITTPNLTNKQKFEFIQNLLNIFNMEFCPLFDEFILNEGIEKNHI